MNRKVLILSYYWPPSGGPGVQRVLKFVKYLPGCGWEPVVITVKNGEYPAIDLSLEQEIPQGIQVYKVASLEFFNLFRKMTGRKKGDKIETYELVKQKDELSVKDRLAQFVRMNFLIPDARIGWNIRGYRTCLKIIKKEKPDLIFSSSPPHSIQVLASRLAARTGIRWVADFRDPWTRSFYDKGMKRWWLAENYNKYLERKIIKNADCVTAVSEGVLELLGAGQARKTKVISNGFDPEDFNHAKQRNSFFTIVYTGHIASVQNPVLFFQAVAGLVQDPAKKIKVQFYGSADPSVHRKVNELGLEKTVEFMPYISHREVTRVMIQADLLLLLIPRENAKGILTGKLFEYLAAGQFILGIGDENGIAASVLEKCKSGRMLDYDKDPAGLITDQYIRWTEGQIHQGEQKEIDKYSRRHLTRELSKLFSALCE